MHFICKILVTVMNFFNSRKDAHRTSLVVSGWKSACQCVENRLDPGSRKTPHPGATNLLHHNYKAHTLRTASHKY